MFLSDISVKRPVFATVINLLIVTFGVVAFSLLPLREYPDVDPPIVSIDTRYDGASAAIIETQITQPLEDRISGISGIKSIESTSKDGRSRIRIEFDLSRDIDAAANDVRERISRGLRNLPEQAEKPEVFKSDDDDNVIAWFNLRSDKLNTLELTDYANRYIVDRFAIVDGVARVRIGGGRNYVLKLHLDRSAMAAKNITVNDIETTLRNENVELPAGEIKSEQRVFSVRVNRTFQTIDDYKKIVIQQDNGNHLVRLAEVARVELTALDEKTLFRSDGVNMVGLGVIKQSKANTLDVIKGAKKELKLISESLPDGMKIVDSYDSSIFIQGAIDEVYNTLKIAIVLVVVVIFVFLGSVRATLIPAVTVPVALIGSLISLYWLGFSINLLTLLALVLAIGLVVDDSIVVLENIYRHLEQGKSPLSAAYHGAREVGFAVVATTLVLVAVFVPLVFMQGNIGRLFTEFALAVTAAVIFSSITALTLSPMMCSVILKQKDKKAERSVKEQPRSRKGYGYYFNHLFSTIECSYKRSLSQTIQSPILLFVILVLAALAVYSLFKHLPSEYAPKEDRGNFFISMKSAEGASYASNVKNIEEIEQILFKSQQQGDLKRVLVRVPGFGGSGGIAIVGMPDWDDRNMDTFSYIEQLRPELNKIVDVRAFAIMRKGIGGRGVGRPVQFVLQGNTYDELAHWRDKILEQARQNPGLIRLDSDYQETSPQFRVVIDRERAADLGVSVNEIGKTIQTMLGQRRVTTYVDRGEEYDVVMAGHESDYNSPKDIANVYVRSSTTKRLIPLANVLTVYEQASAKQLSRFNRLRSITISANLAEDYTLGEALTFLNALVDVELPEHASVDYKGQSDMFYDSANSMLFVFALALLVTYFVLAAQFESFIHPFVILLAVPLALVGALIGLEACGMSINIYSQIGLVMLIGLAAKNGILIVEFTNQLRDKGHTVKDALIEASTHRLRPIVMTSFTTVMSAIPLMLAEGPGSESRAVIGIVIFSGVAVSSFMTLFIIPSAYWLLCQRTGSPLKRTLQLKDESKTEED